MAASEQTGGMPVTASGSSLEIRRADRTVVLKGPAIVREGARELSADSFSVELDADYHARRAVAEGHPQIRTAEGGGKISVSAAQLEAVLNPAGWVERVAADGNVIRHAADGCRHRPLLRGARGIRHGAAEKSDSGHDRDRRRDGGIASGRRFACFEDGRAARDIFRRPPRTAIAARRAARRISSESKAPRLWRRPPFESTSSSDVTTLRAKKFVAQLGPRGRLDKLLGHAGVEVRRQIGNAAPQTLSAAEMIATFGAHGEWDTLDERGNVRFQQSDRQATADHANLVRATDIITLDGSPVISDAMSRTTAANVVINQKSGELRATGGVVSTYVPTAQGDSLSLGSGAAHISADALSGTVGSSHVIVTYAGHARLWQGESVLDSDQIQLWQDDKKLQASGHVVAVFSQVSGPFAAVSG